MQYARPWGEEVFFVLSRRGVLRCDDAGFFGAIQDRPRPSSSEG
ncbi:MAG: hypothetical protein R3B82_03860 [Sandaracinaceae bacterium]